MAKLSATQQPTAAALMEEGPVDPHIDFLANVDMTQLHRCVHLHECLGKLPVFQVISLSSVSPGRAHRCLVWRDSDC